MEFYLKHIRNMKYVGNYIIYITIKPVIKYLSYNLKLFRGERCFSKAFVETVCEQKHFRTTARVLCSAKRWVTGSVPGPRLWLLSLAILALEVTLKTT